MNLCEDNYQERVRVQGMMKCKWQQVSACSGGESTSQSDCTLLMSTVPITSSKGESERKSEAKRKQASSGTHKQHSENKMETAGLKFLPRTESSSCIFITPATHRTHNTDSTERNFQCTTRSQLISYYH